MFVHRIGTNVHDVSIGGPQQAVVNDRLPGVHGQNTPCAVSMYGIWAKNGGEHKTLAVIEKATQLDAGVP